MSNYKIKTPEQALVYLTDCALATVAKMASKKNRAKFEYERHISIAQTSVNLLKYFKVDIEIGSRAYDVLSLPDQNVKTWAKKFDSA